MKYILGLLLLSFNALASNSATIILHGTVPSKTDVTTTSASISLAVDADATDLVLTTLGIKTNRAASLTITSANSFNLVKSGFATQIPYSLTLGTTAVTSSAIAFSALTNVNRDLKITYTAVDPYLMEAGDYTDTLTLTIVAQ
jgi:hypothetical protein